LVEGDEWSASHSRFIILGKESVASMGLEVGWAPVWMSFEREESLILLAGQTIASQFTG
jgi:hypothetical protein